MTTKAKKSKVVPLRVPENLYQLAELRAQIEHTDRSTALRQWLHEGASRYALQLVSEGRISGTRAAEYLGLTIYDIHHLAETYGLEIGATMEQWNRSVETLERLLAESKERAGTQ